MPGTSSQTVSINVRLTHDVIDRLDALASKDPDMNRSRIIRLLLGAALDDDAKTLLTRELSVDMVQARKEFAARIVAHIGDAMPQILEQGLQSLQDR